MVIVRRKPTCYPASININVPFPTQTHNHVILKVEHWDKFIDVSDLDGFIRK